MEAPFATVAMVRRVVRPAMLTGRAVLDVVSLADLRANVAFEPFRPVSVAHSYAHSIHHILNPTLSQARVSSRLVSS
jgi:hypothetical protein